MIRYTEEKKAAALKRMMAPESCSVAKLSVELGISESCLYHWRINAQQQGLLMGTSINPRKNFAFAGLRFFPV